MDVHCVVLLLPATPSLTGVAGDADDQWSPWLDLDWIPVIGSTPAEGEVTAIAADSLSVRKRSPVVGIADLKSCCSLELALAMVIDSVSKGVYSRFLTMGLWAKS